MHANVAYNEYIGDKEHLHMNSTKWETLTGFVKYLGKEGLCHVEETPKACLNPLLFSSVWATRDFLGACSVSLNVDTKEARHACVGLFFSSV